MAPQRQPGGNSDILIARQLKYGQRVIGSDDIIDSINVTDAGSGYATAPAVTIAGTGGATATAILKTDDGLVRDVTIATADQGAGYDSTDAPTVTFSAPGGGGTTATGTVVIAGGKITGITITNRGSGYTSAPTITLSGGAAPTTAATPANWTVALGFGIARVDITHAGSGYTAVPAVTIAAPTGGIGTQATATATLGDIFNGTAPVWGTKAALTRKIFPFTRNTLDPTGEKTRSESIVGGNSASPGILAGRGGGGEWEFELLPEDAIHMLLGWFNPDSLPTNTALDPQTIPTAVIGTIPGSGTTRRITMNNDEDGAQAKWPGQLKITLTGAVGNGTVRINGIKRGSRSNKYNPQVFETVTVSGATPKIAKNFYYQVNSLDLTGFTTFPSEIVLEYVPDTKWVALTLHTLSELFNGWSTQMRKAGSPFVGFDVIPNAFRLSIGTNIRLLMTLLASYVQEHRTLVDPNEIAYQLPNYNTPNTGILARYPKAALNFYPAFGSAFVIGNPGETIADLRTRIDAGNAEPTAITGFELNGTHNYEPPGGYTGDPSTGKPITADGQTRLVTAEATVFHETDTAANNNETIFWQDRFFDNIFVPIILRNYNWLSDGRQVMLEAACPNCELTAVPGLPIEGGGQVNRILAFQANPSEGATSPDEISMRFFSKDGFKE